MPFRDPFTAGIGEGKVLVCASEPVNSLFETQIVALDWKVNVEQQGEGPFILILDAPVRDFDVT